MKYKLRILRRAQTDAHEIFEWIHERSPAGAKRWFVAFQSAGRRVQDHPLAWPLAPENEFVDYEVRHIPFRTPKGRMSPFRSF